MPYLESHQLTLWLTARGISLVVRLGLKIYRLPPSTSKGMATTTLVDSGPIVALINQRDCFHAWCVSRLETLTDPLLTCDAVLSEAFYLLKRHTSDGPRRLTEMIHREILVSDFALKSVAPRVMDLLKKYQDLPTSFADACLVAMAERHDDAKIWTLDSDFRIYRKHDRRVIPLIIPDR